MLKSAAAVSALLLLAACDSHPTHPRHHERKPCTPLAHPIQYHEEIKCQEDVPK